MDTLMLRIAIIIGYFTPWGIALSIPVLIIGTILDVVKKRFYWSKSALIFVCFIILLLIIQISLAYQISNSFI